MHISHSYFTIKYNDSYSFDIAIAWANNSNNEGEIETEGALKIAGGIG
jgi:hypothetical protein